MSSLKTSILFTKIEGGSMKVLLGKRIKELRTQKRLTQEQLAEMVDMVE